MTAPADPARRRRALWRLGALLGFLAIAVAVGLFVPLPSAEEIRAAAEQAGWLGALLFVFAYGLITLTPVPKNVVGIAAGLVWGFGLGALLVYLGALLGAAAAFAIGRTLGREAIEAFTGARIGRVDDLLRRRGLASVIGARLIPVLPFTVINYTASLTAVSRRDYAIGTAVGIIPGTLVFVAIGAFGFESGPGLTITLTALGLLTLIGVAVGFRNRRRAREQSAAAPGSTATPGSTVTPGSTAPPTSPT